MRLLVLRGVRPAVVVVVALAALVGAACTSDDLDRGARYVEDPEFRASALLQSFVNPDNGYAALRRAHYASDWAELGEWNPPVRPLTQADVGAFAEDPWRPSTPSEPALLPVLDRPVPWTEESLLELGRRAFETYPVQLSDAIGDATRDPEHLARYGLWTDTRGRVGGLTRVRMPDGSERFGLSCASCHARVDQRRGALIHGAANADLDWGGALYDRALSRGVPHEAIAHLAQWGPGQVDVTPDEAHNPVAITDLRAVAMHEYLHWAGTLENDLIALAIRIETLIITSMERAVRPPREVAFALALYVSRLGEGRAAGDAGAQPQGAALFAHECRPCHAADGTTPRPRVRLDVIGTDPAVGLSSTRGTGYYRTPSLWAVAERDQLLHDGSLSSLDELLDPARLTAHPGHAYGMDLSSEERASLIAFVRTIGAPE